LGKKLVALSLEEEPPEPGSQGDPVVFPPRPRFYCGLPRQEVQEVMGIEPLVIIEYLAQLLLRRFQEVIRRQLLVNTG